MTSEKVDLPSDIRISKFADARIQEIQTLTEFLATPNQGQLPSQKLSKHLRRRAVSHNPNRLPKRLRQRHIEERLKSHGDNKSAGPPKRPSRRYRRRPSNLLSEYNRRQRSAQWLETHIWHAKRFHMSPANSQTGTKVDNQQNAYCQGSRWGYKLPDYPNDKSFRACYRAVVHKCLMQDISYYCCIELQGPQKSLIDGLSQLRGPSKEMGLGFGSPDVLSGRKEGFSWLYHPKQFPHGVIGKVSFIWKPKQDHLTDDHSTVWIWSHPSFYNETWEALKDVFGFVQKVERDPSEEPPCKKTKFEFSDPILKAKMDPRNIPGSVKVPVFEGSYSDAEIKAFLLKDTLNRFRLVGPLAQTILKDVLVPTTLRPHDINESKTDSASLDGNNSQTVLKEEDSKNSVEIESESVKVSSTNSDSLIIEKTRDSYWWHEYLKSDLKAKTFEENQNSFWSRFSQFFPGEIHPRLVTSLVVRDPRKMLPPKRGCSQTPCRDVSSTELSAAEKDSYFSSCPLESPIWNMEIRDIVTSTKIPDHTINSLRSKFLTSVSLLPLDQDESRIPSILIHQPGAKDHGGFGAGWDIILPAGWGMPFWMSFVFHGARVGGLRESRQLDLEMGRLGHLDNSPDSKMGKAEMQREKSLLKAVHLSYPPDKRPNFSRLGSATPFEAPWSILVKDWSKKLVLASTVKSRRLGSNNGDDLFYVIRESQKLSKWKDLLARVGQNEKNKFEISEEEEKALVPVQIDVVGKGTVGPFSMICLPSKSDLVNFNQNKENKKIGSGDCFAGPTEPLQEDSNRDNRTKLKETHRKEKISLQRKCKELKQSLNLLKVEKIDLEIKSDQQNSSAIKIVLDKMTNITKKLNDLKETRVKKNIEFSIEMERLWLDDINNQDSTNNFVATVRESASREIFGYVQFGGISYRKSKHSGLGFASTIGIKNLIEMSDGSKEVIVLVRQTHSLQYRYARISISLEN